MDFALVPDNGPHRIVRFVDGSQMPSDDVVSMLDRIRNVLLVNTTLYDQLTREEQSAVIKTRQQYLTITRTTI